jgi:hypothetical protein
MAICYARWAAIAGISIRTLTVDVEADYDARGQYGVNESPAGYTALRCIVYVDSDSPPDEVFRMLDEADRRSPYLDVFRRAIPVVRETRITQD